jgi:hypothetical protein
MNKKVSMLTTGAFHERIMNHGFTKVINKLKRYVRPINELWEMRKPRVRVRIYYNFIRPHMALNGITPSQKAKMDAESNEKKWLSLIKKAAKQQAQLN